MVGNVRRLQRSWHRSQVALEKMHKQGIDSAATEKALPDDDLMTQSALGQ